MLRSRKPVEAPDYQDVAVAQGLQAAREPGPVVPGARRPVLVDLGPVDAGRKKRVKLQVDSLGSVGLRDPHVSDQHAVLPKNGRY